MLRSMELYQQKSMVSERRIFHLMPYVTQKLTVLTMRSSSDLTENKWPSIVGA